MLNIEFGIPYSKFPFQIQDSKFKIQYKMNKEFNKIQKFTDLVVWQEGHKLVLMVYKETKGFPSEEKYGLVNQMRRAAVSFTSNIAEGFSRKSSKEKHQFYSNSFIVMPRAQ